MPDMTVILSIFLIPLIWLVVKRRFATPSSSASHGLGNTMADNFRRKVEAQLDLFFREHKFDFDGVRSDEKTEIILFYKSPLQKIGIYDSRRNGEINCLIGSPDAKHETFPKGKGWVYLNAILLADQHFTLEELLARVPRRRKGDEELIAKIADGLRMAFTQKADKLPRSAEGEGRESTIRPGPSTANGRRADHSRMP